MQTVFILCIIKKYFHGVAGNSIITCVFLLLVLVTTHYRNSVVRTPICSTMSKAVDSSLSGTMLSAAVVLLGSLLSVSYVSNEQPLPYMDEMFHVRQSLVYVHGNWSQWDEKITTPPGMYVISVVMLKLLSSLGFKPAGEYSAFHFRLFSAVWSAVNFVLLSWIFLLRTCHTRTVLSLCLIFHPVLYFFSFLYYTDQCSLAFVLLGFLCSLQHRRFLSALFCALSVTVRQTNIVWSLLAVCPFISQAVATAVENEKTNDNNNRNKVGFHITGLVTQVIARPCIGMRIIWLSLKALSFHLLVLLFFILFLWCNGGIVLGDKTAHRAILNIPQLWYFATFCALSTPFDFARFVWTTARSLWSIHGRHRERRSLLASAAGFCCCVGAVAVSLMYLMPAPHPYLLADNRHYTFYIWRRLLHPSRSIYVLHAPWFTLCAAYVVTAFVRTAVSLQDVLSAVSCVVGTVLTLVPASLLEPRYFLVPYVLWRVLTTMAVVEQHKGSGRHRLARVVELMGNIVVSVVLVYVFVHLPFHWPNEPGIRQRFMW